MRHGIRLFAISATLFVTACAAYHAQPITREKGDDRLADPSPDAPTISSSKLGHPILHPISGGVLDGTNDGFGLGVNWDIQELISRDAHIASAKENSASVNLEIAWQEWQIAEAAEQAAVDLISLQAQRQADQDVDARLA